MPDLLMSSEAAAMVGGSGRLTRLVKTGKLPYFLVGHGKSLAAMRFTAADVNAALATLSVPKTPTVYVLGFGSYVKIGFTTDLSGRIVDLQEHLPEALTLHASFPGSIADERRLHRRFASCRTRGEWFRKRGKLRAWIAEGCPADAP